MARRSPAWLHFDWLDTDACQTDALGRRIAGQRGAQMKRFLPVVVAFVPAAVFLGARGPAAVPASDSKMATPRYDETGALVRPEGFEQWTFVGANIGMSYAEEAQAGPGEFHNIYTQPEAYAAYAATGRFPEKTMFLLVV